MRVNLTWMSDLLCDARYGDAWMIEWLVPKCLSWKSQHIRLCLLYLLDVEYWRSKLRSNLIKLPNHALNSPWSCFSVVSVVLSSPEMSTFFLEILKVFQIGLLSCLDMENNALAWGRITLVMPRILKSRCDDNRKQTLSSKTKVKLSLSPS